MLSCPWLAALLLPPSSISGLLVTVLLWDTIALLCSDKLPLQLLTVIC